MSNVKKEIVKELHKPARINFIRRKVITRGLDDLHQADLVEMIPYARENKGYRYILVVIDVFSKFVWVEPVKRKTGENVANALHLILKKSKRIPKNLQTDLGKEFYNEHMKQIMQKYKINHYSVYSSKKASVVERVNRTLKSKMWERFSLEGSYKWLKILQDLINEYNNKVHRTIGMKPSKVNKRNEEKLLQSVYNYPKKVDLRKMQFKVGDRVRISKYRELFEKGYTPNWSNEIFKINRIKLSYPIMYYLEDDKGEEIKGGFYGMELQKAKHPDIYLVERVLKRKGNMVFVKWLGFNQSHNSWIPKNNVLK